jgi:SM-20-related protein
MRRRIEVAEGTMSPLGRVSSAPVIMASDEAIIQILDGSVPSELRAGAWEAVSAKRWYFGNQSLSPSEPSFWKMDLDEEPAITAVYASIRARCEELAKGPLVVLRQYANGHTYGLGGQAHADDSRPGHYTCLYYPMLDWSPDWGGETVFHHQTGEIALAVLPKPGRALFFDSRILHSGRAPSRAFGGLRVTVAFKLGPATSG